MSQELQDRGLAEVPAGARRQRDDRRRRVDEEARRDNHQLGSAARLSVDQRHVASGERHGRRTSGKAVFVDVFFEVITVIILSVEIGTSAD